MKKINYDAKNFADYRNELVTFIKQYYPETLKDFNDSSVGVMLLELNAAIADNLSFHTDKMFNETQLDYAKERKNILAIARNNGVKIPGKKPSITVVDITVTVPTFSDTFDVSYAPVIQKGSQFVGGNKIFESIYDIDFSSPFSLGGVKNRLVLPNTDSNGNITSYNLVKREIVINGVSRIFKQVITLNESKPFFEVVLPEQNVISVESVVLLPGTSYTQTPTTNDFYNDNFRFYEVDSLAEDKIFVVDGNKLPDSNNIPYGKYIRIDNKFITEYTDNGFLKLIFGSGTKDLSSLFDFGLDPMLLDQLGDFVNNNSLGNVLKPNSTLFIKYKVGGGLDSNLGSGVINGLGISNIIVNGNDNNINNSVIKSVKVTNPIPAIGGRDELTTDEIRNLVKYNFASQNRAVTIKDYISRLKLMPGEFGIPYKFGVFEESNKIKIFLLSQDENGNIKNESSDALRLNIAEYLSDYRMLNDYIEISNGRVYNLGVECDIFSDKNVPQTQIVNQVLNTIKEYFNTNKKDMGENIYISPLIELINNINGVLNVVDIRFYAKVGNGVYSINEPSQPYINDDTKQIDLLSSYTLFGDPIGLYEIKLPNKDIKVRITN